jgi:hypothetical protein
MFVPIGDGLWLKEENDVDNGAAPSLPADQPAGNVAVLFIFIL